MKFWLGWISVGFDVVFGLQHWVLYPEGKGRELDDEREGDGGRARTEEEGRALLRESEVDARDQGAVYGTVC